MKTDQIFALWPIAPFGGDNETGDQGGNNDGGQQNNDGSSNNDASQGNSGQPAGGAAAGNDNAGASDDDDDDDDEYSGYSAKELRRIAKDLKKGKTATDAELKALKDKEDAEKRKKNDDVTNLTNDLTTERDTNKTLRATITKQAIIGAIRDDSRFTWHDPEMVAAQLDPEIVKVDDHGKVEGIKSQLAKVAKDHPFLLKSDNTKQNQQGGQQNNGSSGPTGFQPGQGGASGGGTQTDTKKLAEDYPALAGRF